MLTTASLSCFNFSTHSLHSSFRFPHLVCLFCSYCSQTCLIYPFSPPTLSLSCWCPGFLCQFTFLLLHFQLCFLGSFGFEVTAAPCYLILAKGMVQSMGDGSSPCCHWSPGLDLTLQVSPVKLWMSPEPEREITGHGVQVALPASPKRLRFLLESTVSKPFLMASSLPQKHLWCHCQPWQFKYFPFWALLNVSWYLTWSLLPPSVISMINVKSRLVPFGRYWGFFLVF